MKKIEDFLNADEQIALRVKNDYHFYNLILWTELSALMPIIYISFFHFPDMDIKYSILGFCLGILAIFINGCIPLFILKNVKTICTNKRFMQINTVFPNNIKEISIKDVTEILVEQTISEEKRNSGRLVFMQNKKYLFTSRQITDPFIVREQINNIISLIK